MAHRIPVLTRRHQLRGTAEIQRNIIARRLARSDRDIPPQAHAPRSNGPIVNTAELDLLTAEATLATADDELGALPAKATAGQAARRTARHCQQVLGGFGFTAEHEFHRHVRRVLVLDELLGSTTDLTREAGVWVRTRATAARLAQL